MPSGGLRLEGRARFTRMAHLFKAVAKQHHKELIPILRPVLPEDGIVFDVGAHAGQMAKLFARMAPRGRVYAFEPGAYALSILRPAVKLRGRGRITVEPIALGAEPGTLTLTTPIKRSGSYGFGLSHLGFAGEGRSFRHEVEVDTIDRYVERHRITRLHLIKADIEGWELRMLAGARHTLATLKPALVLEAVDAYLSRAEDSRPALWRFLSDLGYRPHRLEPGLPPFAPEADGDVVWICGT
ncbi:MAG TPA: FkbM family methyltransferase [Alphaproteobacteria bacterium]|nr:FkbM family methyltransferase [Alphaproteobacteria bacterium]